MNEKSNGKPREWCVINCSRAFRCRCRSTSSIDILIFFFSLLFSFGDHLSCRQLTCLGSAASALTYFRFKCFNRIATDWYQRKSDFWFLTLSFIMPWVRVCVANERRVKNYYWYHFNASRLPSPNFFSLQSTKQRSAEVKANRAMADGTKTPVVRQFHCSEALMTMMCECSDPPRLEKCEREVSAIVCF